MRACAKEEAKGTFYGTGTRGRQDVLTLCGRPAFLKQNASNFWPREDCWPAGAREHVAPAGGDRGEHRRGREDAGLSDRGQQVLWLGAQAPWPAGEGRAGQGFRL